jgi:predicted N-acetyltransferase YhbS
MTPVNMNIIYKTDIVPTADAVIAVYASAGLNRPLADKDRIAKMYANSNLVVTAWDGDTLVGVSRALTDFCYCCYLSDLAVMEEYKKCGIGKRLIEITKKEIGEQAMLLLLSAAGAMEYYPKVGFEAVHNGFIIRRKR